MVEDKESGAAYRADHLLEDHIEVLLKDKEITEEKKTEYTKDLNRKCYDNQDCTPTRPSLTYRR